MKFTSQICTTKEQSERLLALGLKKETADCLIVRWDDEHTEVFQPNCGFLNTVNLKYATHIRAWSLHRLIEIANTYIEFSPFTGVYFRDGAFITDRTNDYDALIDIIEWLIKEEDFNKEYLEV